MKMVNSVLVFVGIAAIGIVLALGVGIIARQAAPVPDTGELLAEAGDIVESIAAGDVRFLQQVIVLTTWANGVYLTQAMPFTITAVAGAVLGLGLGLAMVAVAFRVGGYDE